MAADTRWWKYLEQQRTARGIKGPTDFARFLGIARSKLLPWQQGGGPAVDSIKDLAKRLEVPVQTLLIEAELFDAEDFGLTHLPADPATLTDDQLLDELRLRLTERRPGGADADDVDPVGHMTQSGGPFRGARRGRRRVSGDQALSSELGEPANGDTGD